METIENTIEHIGTKIKYYRLLNKISLSKLADEANISKSTLFGLEEGRSNPTISTLMNIAKTLNITLNELIGSNSDLNSQSNLTLISTPDDEKYRLYKLTLLPNELFKLQEILAANMEIEVIEGALSLIDKSTTLYTGESIVVNYNQYFKALNTPTVAMLKIYKLQDNFYIKDDIFHKIASKELLSKIIKNSRKRLISRAVFTTISPMEEIECDNYMNYIEVLSNKESYYYIFRRYQGLLGGINQYLKNIDMLESTKNNQKYKNLNKFLSISNSNKSLKREDFNLINQSIIEDIKDIIYYSTSDKYDSLHFCQNIFDVDSKVIKNNEYILLIEDLTNEIVNKTQLTITIMLYRALENLFIIDDILLNSSELKLYTKIVENLLKALYYAYNGYIEIAINSIKKLSDIDCEENRVEDSKFIKNYKNIIKIIKQTINYYEQNIDISTINSVESIAKDLNLSIVAKELISPVVGDSGLYVYLFKIEK